MDNFENTVCVSCGVRKNDALLAGFGNFCRCSGSYHDELWPNFSRMFVVGQKRELPPSFCHQNGPRPEQDPDIKDDIGAKTVASSSNVKHQSERDPAIEDDVGGAKAAASFTDENEPEQDPTIEDDIGAKAAASSSNENEPEQDRAIEDDFGGAKAASSSTNVNETERDCTTEDDVGAVAAAFSSNERTEISGEANINNCRSLRLLNRPKKQFTESPQQPPEVYQTLKKLDFLVTGAGKNNMPNKKPPSSNVEIVSSEKIMAAGMSHGSQMRESKDPDVLSYLLQRMAQQDLRIDHLENKLTVHDSLLEENSCFRLHLGREMTYQRNAIQRLQLDLQHLALKVEALSRNFMQAHINIRRLQEKTELNRQRIEFLVRRLGEVNEKVTAYLNLLRQTEIRIVE